MDLIITFVVIIYRYITGLTFPMIHYVWGYHTPHYPSIVVVVVVFYGYAKYTCLSDDSLREA
jgi:hypothetical protein